MKKSFFITFVFLVVASHNIFSMNEKNETNVLEKFKATNVYGLIVNSMVNYELDCIRYKIEKGIKKRLEKEPKLLLNVLKLYVSENKNDLVSLEKEKKDNQSDMRTSYSTRPSSDRTRGSYAFWRQKHDNLLSNSERLRENIENLKSYMKEAKEGIEQLQ